MTTSGTDVAGFVNKWSRVELSERAASQEHFIDLCRLLGQPTPADHDATGAEYTFEKGVSVTDTASRGSKGERGFADVWWKGKFAWEYKRKDKYKDLAEAYRQLCQYREALENPPLLVVCDISRLDIHTNFTGTKKEVHTIPLDQIGHPDNLDKLRRVFTDPHSFKPTLSTTAITEAAAAEFAKIADRLRQRNHDPHDAAHFLMKCMFCLFAEDVNLLPKDLFSKLLEHGQKEPAVLAERMDALFASMRSGGYFGVDTIRHFNGGLFDGDGAIELHGADIKAMRAAGAFDWGAVEPSVFGTLFERSLDPSKRSQIGAHYTSREDIMLIVEPVVMQPLRREWESVREQVEDQLQRRRKARTPATRKKADEKIESLISGFLDRLSHIRVLDPACGSGNFLYVAIQELLALEKTVIVYAQQPHIGHGYFPRVRPTQLHGIELNPYAAELAQMVIWIGYLQWMQDNGFIDGVQTPILEPLQTIECRDAILRWTDEAGEPIPTWRAGAACIGAANWPAADFIIGNPPFLGSKLFRQYDLPEPYIDAMYEHFQIPNTSDLCCYWFELARFAIANDAVAAGGSPDVECGKRATPNVAADGSSAGSRKRKKSRTPTAPRAGLLATQGIRGGDNRKVLERIKDTGDIFMAWSDREWILDGAAVHVSMVGFDGGAETSRTLDGEKGKTINADLQCSIDATLAGSLRENDGLYVRSPEKGAKFEVEFGDALHLLRQPNPNGRPTSDVLIPWINGFQLVGGHATQWIIDFHSTHSEDEAAAFEAAFESVKARVYEARMRNRDPRVRKNWWRHRRSGDGVRQAAAEQQRLLGTTMVSKYRLFRWIDSKVQPDKTIPIFARSDDYFFGVLHSSIHELWALRMGTQLEDRPRYTPTTCFETFALPWVPGKEPDGTGAEAELHARIGEAAAALNEQRERWLNPPEWIEDLGRYVDGKHDFADVPADARALIRHSAIMAEAARDPRLKKRTLTNLYNERPTWLRLAHEKLDRAVLAAYAAIDPEGAWDEDWAVVWAETGAGWKLPEDHALVERRAEVDERVLGNLLRLNLARSGGGA